MTAVPGSLLSGTTRFIAATAVAVTIAGVAALSSATATAAGVHNPLGHVHKVTVAKTTAFGVAAVRLVGWAFDPDATTSPVTVSVTVDKRVAARTTTRAFRGHVARRYHAGRHTGWVTAASLRSGRHTLCVSVANLAAGVSTSLGCRTVRVAVSANRKVVRSAARHLRQPYVEGAAGPSRFDCSGLVQYTYRKAGLNPPRVAQDQYRAARRIRESRAVPGDLVFYHDGSGYTYHVAIYTGRHMTIAAANSRQGVIRERIWDRRATFGSFTHR